MPTYTRADLKARINAGIKGKLGILTDANETINQALRAVVSEKDIRSTRRMVAIHPGIFDEVLAYPAPADLKARKLVSIKSQAQANDVYYGFNLIPYEQFNQRLGFINNRRDGNFNEVNFGNQRELYTVAFDDLGGVRRILISAPEEGTSQVLSTLDTLTAGGGLWTSFGDAENVDADLGNYVRGSGSIKFDIDAAGGTTAGIYNATLDTFDISAFLEDNAAFFTFAYISDKDDITNYTLRIGVDASNYYEIVVTATHGNTEFLTGWNTLRFDMENATVVGTVDTTACEYMALFMTKDAAKISEGPFRFDHVVARTGKATELRYYSKYPWQSQAGVWKENSDSDDDYINAESDEYDFIVDKGIVMAGMEVEEATAADAAQVRFDRKMSMYLNENPSEALVQTSDYQAQYYI